MGVVFKDRTEAGRRLAGELEKYAGKGTVIYALPRGGVPVGAEIARRLHAPLDLMIIRKIGHPLNPEYAICAVSENAGLVCSEEELEEVDEEWFKRETEKERREAKRRREAYLKGRKSVSPEGRTAILVDDGIATGLSMLAAIRAIKQQNPKRVVVAVPVAPREAVDRLSSEVNELVVLDIPDYYLGAVGAYYESFPQVTDEEVIQLIRKSN